MFIKQLQDNITSKVEMVGAFVEESNANLAKELEATEQQAERDEQKAKRFEGLPPSLDLAHQAVQQQRDQLRDVEQTFDREVGELAAVLR